jgi:hypothetical protein
MILATITGLAVGGVAFIGVGLALVANRAGDLRSWASRPTVRRTAGAVVMLCGAVLLLAGLVGH